MCISQNDLPSSFFKRTCRFGLDWLSPVVISVGYRGLSISAVRDRCKSLLTFYPPSTSSPERHSFITEQINPAGSLSFVSFFKETTPRMGFMACLKVNPCQLIVKAKQISVILPLLAFLRMHLRTHSAGFSPSQIFPAKGGAGLSKVLRGWLTIGVVHYYRLIDL